MITKYGEIPNNDLILYFKRLIPQMYKLMPMKENKNITYEKYLTKLIRQLHGGNRLIISSNLFIEILFNLESLFDIEDVDLHNSLVKENITTCQTIIHKLEKEDVGMEG
ncbi:hypothetical protein KY334_05460 [Candidatus Woesearchaeota archaeon]|nr:hypothetical protein [Candidatus Woesearchaeota archaeon]